MVKKKNYLEDIIFQQMVTHANLCEKVPVKYKLMHALHTQIWTRYGQKSAKIVEGVREKKCLGTTSLGYVIPVVRGASDSRLMVTGERERAHTMTRWDVYKS